MVNYRGFKRKQSSPIRGPVFEFAWGDETSIRIAGIRAWIRTRDDPNLYDCELKISR